MKNDLDSILKDLSVDVDSRERFLIEEAYNDAKEFMCDEELEEMVTDLVDSEWFKHV